jgi:putative hydroxymethylpyrimidine transport system ATP-binding protein
LFQQAPEISLERISLAFAGKPLFHELNLRLAGGQTTCILGPSGCGKSTLLKLIAGVSPLHFSGDIAFSSGLKQHPVAWMGQNDLLLPWLSLLDNVLLGPRLRRERTPKQDEKARELIQQAGLSGYESALPGTLSGGMRQRAALLRTLMEGRQILLMDEPFSALDALTRVRLQNLSAELTRGATVILVTHDPMEALRLGHRIIVLAGTPIAVVEELIPDTPPPREAGTALLNTHYAHLLSLLMQGAPQ